MRTIPPALAGHLSGATTLCRCWRLARRDGLVLGFTDHDRDLVFDGTRFAAATGLEAAEATSELGFAVGGGEVAGALAAAGLTEEDLALGSYDEAVVEIFLVNWAEPEERLALGRGVIGEVRRADGAFIAEVRGPMHRLDQERGRLYRASCSADLGDARCQVNLAQGTLRFSGTVATSDGALTLTSDGLGGFADGWFTGGRLAWSSGANAGGAVEVRAHRRVDGVGHLDLWQRAARAVGAGDGFTVTAGCDKRFATCRAKFANQVNFRGFPHMPGNDFVVRVVREGDPGLDGGSLFR